MRIGVGMRIGELARTTGVSAHTLRFYESEGLLSGFVRRGQNGYRNYIEGTEERLRYIGLLAAAGFTLAEIKDLLTRWDRGTLTRGEGIALIEKKAAAIDARIADLRRAKEALLAIQQGHEHTDERRS